MLRAPARKEEQRRQRDAALLNRVRSGVTHEVVAGVGRKMRIHAVCPADASGQLRFLGLLVDLCSPACLWARSDSRTAARPGDDCGREVDHEGPR